jgi:integrase
MKLRERDIAALTLPPGKSEAIFFDDDCPGYGVRLREGGSSTFVFQYRIGKRQRRLTFGTVGAMPAARAREQAEKFHAAIKLGRDPVNEKEQALKLANDTVAVHLPEFLASQKKRLRPRSYIEVERHLMIFAKPVHGFAMAKLTRRDVASLLTKIANENSGNATTNRVRTSLSSFCTWLIKQGVLDVNPVSYTERREEKPRDHLLEPGELAQIWSALRDEPYGRIVKLLALSGARREEIGALEWREIDFEKKLISLPKERTKNKRPHVIPLSAEALAILQSQPRLTMPDGSLCEHVFGRGTRGFNDWVGSKADLDKRIADACNVTGKQPPRPWVLHDFRRVMSTTMHEKLAIQPHVVEACLGHVGHQSGIPGVYNLATYGDEKRKALSLWGDYVIKVVEGADNVVPLRA